MKKSILKNIKDLAKELPKLLEDSHTVVLGSEILAKGGLSPEQLAAILPKRYYKLKGKKLVNHEEKLKAAFKMGGVKAITEYCNKIMPKPIIYEQIQKNLKAGVFVEEPPIESKILKSV